MAMTRDRDRERMTTMTRAERESDAMCCSFNHYVWVCFCFRHAIHHRHSSHRAVIVFVFSYWLSGLGLVIFGSLGDFAALSMVAQSIVAPLASTTLVTNVIFAHFWLHETVGRREIAGTALIIFGSTLAVVFGDHQQRQYTNDILINLLSGAWFIVYAVLVLGLCTWGMLLHRKITPIKKQLVDAIRRYEIAVENNDSQGADWEDEVIAQLEVQYKPWKRLHPFALCALSGAFGAQSVLAGKCFAELLSTSFSGNNQMFNAFPYFALICMAATVASQLHFLAIALNYFDALYSVPVFQCFFISVSTLGGALYFREVYSFDVGTAVAFVCGLLMTLAGVGVLSTRKMSERGVVTRISPKDAVGMSPSPLAQAIAEAIPEGDESAADIKDPAARATLHHRGMGLRSSSNESCLSEFNTGNGGGDIEMSDIGVNDYAHISITPSPPSSPVATDSARAQGGTFSERAAAEGLELLEVARTVGESSRALVAKLAREGYGIVTGNLPQTHKQAYCPSPSAKRGENSMTFAEADIQDVSPLFPAASGSGDKIEIQYADIESDQQYINKQKAVHHSDAARRRASVGVKSLAKNASATSGSSTAAVNSAAVAAALAASTDSDPDSVVLFSTRTSSPDTSEANTPRLLSGSASNPKSRTSSFHDGPLGAAQTGAGRLDVPRSLYVQDRERANSIAYGVGGGIFARDCNTDSPSLAGQSSDGANSQHHTPVAGRRESFRVGTDLDTSMSLDPVGAGGLPAHLGPAPSSSSFDRRGSFMISATPGSIRLASGLQSTTSAMFAGAHGTSAQDLPDVASDTRVQRLTRLSTVGHWVHGLHAQVPVVGGVAQAILQANEMQTLWGKDVADQEKKEADEREAAAAAALARGEVPVSKPRAIAAAIAAAAQPIARAVKSAASSAASLLSSSSSSSAASSAAPPAVSSSSSVAIDVSKPIELADGTSLHHHATPLSSPINGQSSPAAVTPVATSTTPVAVAIARPSSPPVMLSIDIAAPAKETITFHDNYDPFSTQSGVVNRDRFANRSATPTSPSASFAAYKRDHQRDHAMRIAGAISPLIDAAKASLATALPALGPSVGKQSSSSNQHTLTTTSKLTHPLSSLPFPPPPPPAYPSALHHSPFAASSSHAWSNAVPPSPLPPSLPSSASSTQLAARFGAPLVINANRGNVDDDDDDPTASPTASNHLIDDPENVAGSGTGTGSWVMPGKKYDYEDDEETNLQ